jgi:hypothetical protein
MTSFGTKLWDGVLMAVCVGFGINVKTFRLNGACRNSSKK